MSVSYGEFLSALAEVLEVNEQVLQPETVLAELPDYDSVKTLSLIVALDELGVNISQSEVSRLSTFGDLLNVAHLRGVLAQRP